MARNTRYDVGDFVVSLLRILVTRTLRLVISRMVACFLPSDICALSQALFMARYSPYKVGGFYPPL